MGSNSGKMMFLIPSNMASVATMDSSERTMVPFYLNPSSFNISYKKLISQTNTKEGFSIQYWGEDLTQLSISGSTGSGGIEAVNILHSVYRNEQLQFQKILTNRLIQSNIETKENAFKTVLNAFKSTDGLKEGIASSIDNLSKKFNESRVFQKVALTPSLGALAVSLDLYFQGVKYRGYISKFSIDEKSDSPGIFSYSFDFTVLHQTGKRENFMPWHRTPYDSAGSPKIIQSPTEPPSYDGLTFDGTPQNRTSSTQQSISLNASGITIDVNDVGINRLNKIK